MMEISNTSSYCSLFTREESLGSWISRESLMFWETGCHIEAESLCVCFCSSQTHTDPGYICTHKWCGATGAADYPIAVTHGVLLQDSSNLVLRTELLSAAGAHWCLAACSTTFGWIWLTHSKTNGANQNWRVGTVRRVKSTKLEAKFLPISDFKPMISTLLSQKTTCSIETFKPLSHRGG